MILSMTVAYPKIQEVLKLIFKYEHMSSDELQQEFDKARSVLWDTVSQIIIMISVVLCREQMHGLNKDGKEVWRLISSLGSIIL